MSVIELAKQLIDKENNNTEEVKENNKPYREYTKAEKMVFALAKKNLDALDEALRNCVISENNCAQIIDSAQPSGDPYDKYYRIVQIISKYDGAWKNTKYEGIAPTTKRSPADRIKQVKEFK